MKIQLLPRREKNAIRIALMALATAIMDAYKYTATQMEEVGYEPEIEQTAFGQYLVHNVMQHVWQLNKLYPGMHVELVPNKRGSSHHVRAEISGLLVTISAVEYSGAKPRKAVFRKDYANRYYFYVNEQNEFELSPDPYGMMGQTQRYMQILHGPHDDDRRTLGFLEVAMPNRDGNYDEHPIPFDELMPLLTDESIGDDVEIVEDIEPLEVKSSDRVEDIEPLEVKSSDREE